MDYKYLSEHLKLIDGTVHRQYLEYLRPLKGHVNSLGYVHIRLHNKWLKLHRVVYSLYHKVNLKRSEQIHHKDGDKTNNSINNLEKVDNRANCQNKRVHLNGKLPGCTLLHPQGKYMAYINPDGSSKPVYLGLFSTEVEAHQFYLKALSWRHLLKPRMSKDLKKRFRAFIGTI